MNEHSTPAPAGRPLRTWLLGLFALLLLNAALTIANHWPTPWPKPAAALSIEALAIAALLGLAAGLGLASGRGRRALVATMAVGSTALLLLHYLDTTLPALLGRPISLYWDGRHLPGLLQLAWTDWPATTSAAVLGGTLILLCVLLALFAWIGHALLRALDTVGPPARLGLTALVAGLALAATATLAVADRSERARAYATDLAIATPITARVWRQVAFALQARSPTAVARQLPIGPSFTGNVEQLAGTDVLLIFLESYGAVTWDNPAFAQRLAEPRRAFMQTLAQGGNQVVSAFVRSPTFGGGSWLAHGSLLSGIDLRDPARYALLMTTDRPTLVTRFNDLGYRSTGLMPGLRSDWSESVFYRFDRLLDSRAIDYRGPDFGFWRIPDQASLARWLELRRRETDGPPQLLFFPSITSHIPFAPIPPYQPDWTRFFDEDGSLGRSAYAAADVAASLARAPNWNQLAPAYLDTMDYNLRWLGGLMAQPHPREPLLILIGDHQPAAQVAGRDAPWDVPVHVITRNAELAARFVAEGFQEGLAPSRPVLGAMHELTALLLRVLSTD